MTSEPKVVIEVAWTDDYSEPFPTWSDITERVLSISTRQGRSMEIGSIEAGTLHLELDNYDGAFTPGRKDSPYYPYVKPRRQFRVRLDNGTSPEVPGPILTNLVPDPNFYGDSLNAGFEFTPSLSSPNLFLDGDGATNGALALDGSVGAQTIAVTDVDGNMFTCNPGDYVSITCSAIDTAYDGSTLAHQYAYIGWYDSSQSLINSTYTGTSVVGPQYTDSGYANAQAPAGAVYFKPQFYIWGMTTGRTYGITHFGAYNHGPTRFDWTLADYLTPPKAYGVEWFGGDTPQDEAFSYAWEGVPNHSRSLAYAVPDRADVIARGYVDEWPADFSGLVCEVGITVVDWTSDFGTKPLMHPLEYEYKRRGASHFYKFSSASNTTEFPDEFDGTRRAVNVLAYSDTSNLYDVSGKTVPAIRGGNDSLAPDALPDEGSARTYNQASWKNGNDTFDLGVCLKVPIDPVDLRGYTAISFAFLWKVYGRIFADLQPMGFILKQRHRDLGKGPELIFGMQGGNEAPTNPQFYIEMRDTAGNRAVHWASTYDAPSDEANLFGFSYDGFNGVVRFQEGRAAFADDGNYFKNDSGTPVWAINYLRGAIFDECYVLGWRSPRAINGFADQAIQYLAEWNYPLRTEDFKAMQRAVDMTAHSIGENAANDRIHYILDQIEWPRELRRIDKTTTVVEPVGWDSGTAALSYLRQAASDSLGAFYADRDGLISFQDRSTRTKNTSPDWIFDCSDGTGVESGLSFRMRQSDVINVASIDNAYGVKTTVRNAASIREYGEVSKSYSLHLADDNEAIQYGYHMTNRYGEPILRVESVTLNPSAQANGALWDAASRIAFGDRVRLAGLPPTAPAAEMDFFVEQIQHSIVRDGERLKWKVTLNISPAQVWAGWILGNSDYSVLGSTTIPLL